MKHGKKKIRIRDLIRRFGIDLEEEFPQQEKNADDEDVVAEMRDLLLPASSVREDKCYVPDSVDPFDLGILCDCWLKSS